MEKFVTNWGYGLKLLPVSDGIFLKIISAFLGLNAQTCSKLGFRLESYR